MGMSIDEAIEIINHYLDYPKEEVRKALLVAIDTMRKYQKIEQIIQDTSTMAGSNDYAIAFIDIKKVVEDGRN